MPIRDHESNCAASARPLANTFGSKLRGELLPVGGMSTDSETPPWQQQLLDSVWLLALAAIIFWMLAYVVWGIVDVLTVPMG